MLFYTFVDASTHEFGAISRISAGFRNESISSSDSFIRRKERRRKNVRAQQVPSPESGLKESNDT